MQKDEPRRGRLATAWGELRRAIFVAISALSGESGVVSSAGDDPRTDPRRTGSQRKEQDDRS